MNPRSPCDPGLEFVASTSFGSRTATSGTPLQGAEPFITDRPRAAVAIRTNFRGHATEQAVEK